MKKKQKQEEQVSEFNVEKEKMPEILKKKTIKSLIAPSGIDASN